MRLQLGKSAPRPYTVAAQNFVKLGAVSRKAGAIIFRVPQVQDTGGEAAILAPDATANKTHDDVGIFQAPAAEFGIEPSTRSMSSRRMPRLQLRAPSQRVALMRRSGPSGMAAIGARRLISPPARRAAHVGRRQYSGSSFSRRTRSVSCGDSSVRLPATNQPRSASRRWVATKSGRTMQSPSRKTQISPPALSTARLRISAARKPRSSCQTWVRNTPRGCLQLSTSAAVAGPEPSSATTTSKRRSVCRESERSTASSASARL